MKKILIVLSIFTLSMVSVFAYTPSDEMKTKMDSVVTKFEDIIDSKGESYRAAVLKTLLTYADTYSKNEKASYILNYLYTQLAQNTSEYEAVSVASSDYTGEYTISDATYGTEVEVTIANGVRTMHSNALANHETWVFPSKQNPNTISEQDKTYEYTTSPSYVGNETWARENGVAYNGIKFELETAERVTCDSGEVYRIEAQQTVIDVIGLDFNNGHVQPTGEYHYHGIPTGAVEYLEGDDVVHVGYASDGFPIYYSKKWSYTPSYSLATETREGTSCTYKGNTVEIEGTTPDGTFDLDWEYVEGSGNLDACNGAYVDGEYGYFVTENFPYGPRCMNGEYSMWRGGGWWQWGQWGGNGQRPPMQ